VIPLLVVAGAVVGAPLRMLADRIAVARRGHGSVLGILTVNVTGSAVLGGLLGLGNVPPAVLALIGTGLCGTLTTFSTFGTDVVRMVEQRQLARSLGYVVASVVLGVGAAALGYVVAPG
jgi:CrcB protein